MWQPLQTFTFLVFMKVERLKAWENELDTVVFLNNLVLHCLVSLGVTAAALSLCVDRTGKEFFFLLTSGDLKNEYIVQGVVNT